MKKMLFTVVLVLGFMFTNAQEVGYSKHTVKLGAYVGVPVGDASDISNFMMGGDVRYQYLQNSLGLGAITGYINYFAKDIEGVETKEIGFIPLAGMVRYYRNDFFVGSDLGYAFSTDSDIDGGVLITPQLGHHTDKFNVYIFFQNIINNNTIQSFGVGATINLKK